MKRKLKHEIQQEADNLKKENEKLREKLKRKDKKLKEVKPLAEVMNSSPNFIFVIDKNYEVISAGHTAKRESEDDGSLSGKNVIDIFGEDKFEGLKRYIDKCINEGEKSNHQTWLDLPKRGRQYCSITVYPLLQNSRITGNIVLSIHPLLEGLKRDEGLRQVGLQFRKIYNVAPVGLAVISAEGKISQTNPKFQKMLGYKRIEFNKLTLQEITLSGDYEREAEQFKKLCKAEINTYSIEKRLITKEGSHLWTNATYVSLLEDYGNRYPAFIMVEDISRRKKMMEDISRYVEELQVNKDIFEQNAREVNLLNTKLHQSREQLKGVIASKDKFFSIIAHDLKSPFTALLGYSELLATDFEEMEPDEVIEFSANIYDEAKRLYSLLENLLEWSRVQTGRVQFEPELVSLNEHTDKVLRLYADSAKRKGIELVDNVPPGTFVFADENTLYTVVRNLVSNALKFSNPAGSVTLTSELRENYVYVTVRDTGIGMSQEVCDGLFRIDVQVTTRGTQNEKGTGLGLILCKELIEKNAGRISVESTPGRGSSFTFTLPVNETTFRAASEQ